MMKNNRILAVIPASGIGHRFGERKPKQYAKLNAFSVIENTVNELLKSKVIDRLIIVISEVSLRYSTNNDTLMIGIISLPLIFFSCLYIPLITKFMNKV